MANLRIKLRSFLPFSLDVDDVMAQEEYREKFPNGESGAPFVFICTNPQELMIKFPMAGKHKICKSIIQF